jgi:hypothetical protein
MPIYNLYGFLSTDINEAKNFLESALNIKFEVHDSSFQGGEYFRSGKYTDENFVLKRNIDPCDNEPAEISWPEYPILFYVNDTTRSVGLRERIDQNAGKVILLRHENLQ